MSHSSLLFNILYHFTFPDFPFILIFDSIHNLWFHWTLLWFPNVKMIHLLILMTLITFSIGVTSRISMQWWATFSRGVPPLWCIVGSSRRTGNRPCPLGARPCCKPLHGLWYRVLAWQAKTSLQVAVLLFQNNMEYFDKYDRKGVYKLICTNCRSGGQTKILSPSLKNTGDTSFMQKTNSRQNYISDNSSLSFPLPPSDTITFTL